MQSQNSTPAVKAVDHLLLGVADLDHGIEWFEKRSGIKAALGGSHPGRGTRNALLSLGSGQYLEIIAPDPAQSAYTFNIDIRNLTEPRLINFAAATKDAAAIAATARKSGYQVFGPAPGSRKTPAGETLRWTSVGIVTQLGSGSIQPVPFFIQWAPDSPHPSQTNPSGCRLRNLRFEHPKPADLKTTFHAFSIDASVSQAGSPRLLATIESPKGSIELS